MKLTSKPLAVIIFVILFGGIGFTSALNWWQTESSKIPAKISEGEAAGEYNPADIRGSYTFGDIESAFQVPAAELAVAFAVQTSDPGSVTLKDLESIYAAAAADGFEVGTASVRLFVALYTGLPYEITEETYLPKAAVDLLLARGGLTTEQSGYLLSHTVESGLAAPVEEATPLAPVSEGESSSDRTIKGKTTFQEVLNWGLPQEDVEVILGLDMPNPLTRIKDFCLEKGLDFETIKLALQAEVDRISP